MMHPPSAQIPSPHGGTRMNTPTKIVVHAMAEFVEQGDSDLPAWALLDRMGFSAHALITPSGVIVRTRFDAQVAYHAKGHNMNSLGVEFLVPGVHTYGSFLESMRHMYLTPAQYAAGLYLVRNWIKEHDIKPDQIFRHSDLSPGRKYDPGAGFPWDRFKEELFA